MSKIFFLLVISVFTVTSCYRADEIFYAENVPAIEATNTYLPLADFLPDSATVNIAIEANGNYLGESNPSFIKNITGANYAYCHPDVEYFPEGFNGYKYWMVFTPYFGSVGSEPASQRFENPTVVVSNDGRNWVPPPGIKNPLASAPSDAESFPENKKHPKMGFWSDPDWLFTGNELRLYYRGCFITAQALKNRGAKSQNNALKLKENAQRTIVRQTSSDGINWSPLEVAYTSNAPYTPKDDHLLSPTFIMTDNETISYEVELNTGKKNFKGKEPSYIIRRTSKDGLNFSFFSKSTIVNFTNTPWKSINTKYAPWHIHSTYVDGYYFLCLAVGDVTQYTADLLYLAYSKDGLNFEVLPKPLIEQNAYRSAIFPLATTDKKIQFGAILAYKTGEFKYKEFRLSKARLNESVN
jgi:hypothetical protein